MGIDPSVIEEVQKRANVYDVISDYITLKRVGSSYTALCPFHNEKTPSFMVSPDKNIFKCFGCGKAGDSIKFVMEYEGLSYIDAVVKLANKYGIPVKYTGKESNFKGLYLVTKKITEFYKEQLKHNKEAKNYLFDRNLSPSVIEHFEIGYSPEDTNLLLKYAKENNITDEELTQIGILNNNKKDRFSGRIIFPIKDQKGNIVAFGGRIIKDSNTAKYINSPETVIYRKSEVLYGFYEAKDYIREKNEVIIVEGYIDLLSLWQIGIKNVVATLGTAFTKEHANLISKFANSVILMFDNDNAGKKAVISASKELLKKDLEIKYLKIPEGKDPADLSTKGYRFVKSLLDQSKDIFDILIDNLLSLKDLQDINTRKKREDIINIYLELLANVENISKLDTYLELLAKAIGTTKDIFYTRLQKLRANIKKESPEEKDKNKLNLNYNERLLLKAIIKDKTLLKKYDFFDKMLVSQLFRYFIEQIKEDKLGEEEEQIILNFEEEPTEESINQIVKKLQTDWEIKELELLVSNPDTNPKDVLRLKSKLNELKNRR